MKFFLSEPECCEALKWTAKHGLVSCNMFTIVFSEFMLVSQSCVPERCEPLERYGLFYWISYREDNLCQRSTNLRHFPYSREPKHSIGIFDKLVFARRSNWSTSAASWSTGTCCDLGNQGFWKKSSCFSSHDRGVLLLVLVINIFIIVNNTRMY